MKEFKKLYSTNEPVEPFDLVYVTKEGKKFSSEIVVSPILENGKTVGTRGMIRDISVRVKAEELLTQAKEAAEYRVSELASINRVAEKVSYSLSLQDILNSVCKELTEVFPVRNAGISLLNLDKSELEVLAFYSTNPSDESHVGKFLSLEGSDEAKNLLEANQTVVIRNAQSDPRTKPIHDIISLPGSSSIMIVPLVIRRVAIGLIGMRAEDPEYDFKQNETELANTIASQIASAIENARLHQQTEKALGVAERDLEIGREIQSGFFPKDLPVISGWEIAAFFKAARQVSGDFYDVFQIGDTGYYIIVVADVCDKGVGAALFMVLLRSLIRSFSEQHTSEVVPEELLGKITLNVNNYIVDTHGQSNMFATLFLGLLDPSNNNFYYVNGGHEPPLIIDASGKFKAQLEPTGPAFGFTNDLEFEIGEVDFLPGEILLAYTDGLTESKNASGQFYSEERLMEQFADKWSSAFSAVKNLEIDVLSYIGSYNQFDDITLVALRMVSTDEDTCHNMSIKADMKNLHHFRSFIEEACRKSNLPDDNVETMKLAVDEVCSNLILHGYKGIPPGNISMALKVLNNELLLEVEDTGHPFDPATLEPPNLEGSIDDREIGGLGVFFVKEMMDDLKYETSAGINRLSLKLKY
jgi:serine phosphatase RsbU (regulator of sigma subunit)/two-component sensor histidine kinase